MRKLIAMFDFFQKKKKNFASRCFYFIFYKYLQADVDVQTLPNSIINVSIFENSSKKIEKSPQHQVLI